MKKNSNKSSVKSSFKNSPNQSQKVLSNNDENILSSSILKSNLQQFYAQSKEKLMALKNEINLIENENEKERDEFNQMKINLQANIHRNEELSIRLKGMKEIMLSTFKNKNNLQNQLKDFQKAIDHTDKDIELYKIDNNYKVKVIQNDIEHTKNTKEDQKKNMEKKIENEANTGNGLVEKINEIKEEIKKYQELIQDFDKVDNARNNNLLKETNDMKKFLAEI
jgi:chromosome segregation ATPase